MTAVVRVELQLSFLYWTSGSNGLLFRPKINLFVNKEHKIQITIHNYTVLLVGFKINELLISFICY